MRKTTFKLSLLVVFFSLVFTSCSSSSENIKEKEKLQREIEEENISKENNKTASFLKKKYNAKVINYNLFTSYNQQIFINDCNLMIISAYIDDVFMVDTTYYLKLGDRETDEFYEETDIKSILIIQINNFQFRKIISDLSENYTKEEKRKAIMKNLARTEYEYTNEKTGVFVVKVLLLQNSFVNNLTATFNGYSYINKNNKTYYLEDDITTTIEGEVSNFYIINGDLIDFYINKKR